MADDRQLPTSTKLKAGLFSGLKSLHSSVPGAVADLVDNYKDAKATKIEIRLEPQGADKQRLIFSGDGKEADAGEVLDIGESTKRLGDPLRDETQIGGYGMGMKNALMHLAADALIICRKQRFWAHLVRCDAQQHNAY